MLPAPFSIMPGTTCLVISQTPLTLTLKIVSKSVTEAVWEAPARADDSGGVDQDVRRAQFVADPADGVGDAVLAGDVDVVLANVGVGRGSRGAGHVQAGNHCAVLGQEGSGGAAQVAAAAGDDGGLSGHSVQGGVHVVLLGLLQPLCCVLSRVTGEL